MARRINALLRPDYDAAAALMGLLELRGNVVEVHLDAGDLMRADPAVDVLGNQLSGGHRRNVPAVDPKRRRAFAESVAAKLDPDYRRDARDIAEDVGRIYGRVARDLFGAQVLAQPHSAPLREPALVA